ncbi:tRNA-specific adenosine deaminase subunit tad3 [Dimargaris cristalligena]|nr:tRNA-specific adenosine deaminase subunit tad3 [Dimargaris cristalligena]
MVAVPKYPPYTRAQFDVWKSLWPIVFRERPERDMTLNEEEVQNLKKYMTLAHTEMVKALDQDKFPRGVVVVDPQSDTVLASATDGRITSPNPLDHAVMIAIEQVALRERQRREQQHPGQVDELTKTSANLGPSTPNSGYLCTGYDVYTTMEPCVIRLFYLDTNPEEGGLKSNFGVHNFSKLNHQYRVYQVTDRDSVTG